MTAPSSRGDATLEHTSSAEPSHILLELEMHCFQEACFSVDPHHLAAETRATGHAARRFVEGISGQSIANSLLEYNHHPLQVKYQSEHALVPP